MEKKFPTPRESVDVENEELEGFLRLLAKEK